MPTPPKFVYFDLGNVILNFSHDLGCVQMAQVAEVDPDVVRQFAFDSDMALQYERGDVSTREFYDYFCGQTGRQPAHEDIIAAGSDIFEINAPILSVLTQLRQRGVPIGVLSNTCDMHWQWVSQGRFRILPTYFNAVALSFELRQVKPDADIYTAAARLAGVEPSEMFFTDDRIENVEGARAAGVDAELFESVAKLVDDLARRGIRLTI